MISNETEAKAVEVAEDLLGQNKKGGNENAENPQESNQKQVEENNDNAKKEEGSQNADTSAQNEQENQIKQLQEHINQLEEQNKNFEAEIVQKKQILQKVSSVFYKLVADGVDLTRFPEIDYELLEAIIGSPIIPQHVAFEQNIDPLVSKIIHSDNYFENVSSNQEFVNRCIDLKKEHEQSKQELEDTLLKSQSVISSSSISRSSPRKKVVVEGSTKESDEQVQFANDLDELLAEKFRLTDEINAIKIAQKERAEQEKLNQKAKTKKVIQLKMHSNSSLSEAN